MQCKRTTIIEIPLTLVLTQALTNRVSAYATHLKSLILQIAVCDYFLTSTFVNTLFQFSEYVKQLLEIRRTWTFKHCTCQILKTNNVICFSFHILCPVSCNLNPIKVPKINLRWSYVTAFSYPPFKQLKLKRVSTMCLKCIKCIEEFGVFEMY